MTMYTPDGWVLLKIEEEGEEPFYKVFGAFRGGFLNGDGWRMNSGVVGVEEDEEYFYFKGSSGSLYKCHKEGYGRLGYYATGVLNQVEEEVKELATVYRSFPKEIIEELLKTQS